MFLKPKEGIIVRDPLTNLPLPSEGKEVNESIYWRRRIQDGDVIVINKKTESSKKQEKKSHEIKLNENNV